MCVVFPRSLPTVIAVNNIFDCFLCLACALSDWSHLFASGAGVYKIRFEIFSKIIINMVCFVSHENRAAFGLMETNSLSGKTQRLEVRYQPVD